VDFLVVVLLVAMQVQPEPAAVCSPCFSRVGHETIDFSTMTASATESSSPDGPPTTIADQSSTEGLPSRVMLWLLRLPLEVETGGPEQGSVPSEDSARSAFQTSIAISAARCTLTYVLLPFVAPLVGIAASIGEPLGIVVALVAVVSIISSMRRFWSVRHRQRWPYTILGGVMLAFLAFLLVTDISNL